MGRALPWRSDPQLPLRGIQDVEKSGGCHLEHFCLGVSRDALALVFGGYRGHSIGAGKAGGDTHPGPLLLIGRVIQ